MTPRSERDLVEALHDAALGQRSWNDIAWQLAGYMDGLTLMLSVQRPSTSGRSSVHTPRSASWWWSGIFWRGGPEGGRSGPAGHARS